tara:strand:- start:152 stop:388 length:237 start_codon:yes stop_codon:yes gene_type:complete
VTSAKTTEHRINELETRLEFQDATIATLNDQLVQLQRMLFEQERTLQRLKERLLAQRAEQDADEPLTDPRNEPPPPHY